MVRFCFAISFSLDCYSKTEKRVHDISFCNSFHYFDLNTPIGESIIPWMIFDEKKKHTRKVLFFIPQTQFFLLSTLNHLILLFISISACQIEKKEHSFILLIAFRMDAILICTILMDVKSLNLNLACNSN